MSRKKQRFPITKMECIENRCTPFFMIIFYFPFLLLLFLAHRAHAIVVHFQVSLF